MPGHGGGVQHHNDQWRVCFEWRDGDAWIVGSVDYHAPIGGGIRVISFRKANGREVNRYERTTAADR